MTTSLRYMTFALICFSLTGCINSANDAQFPEVESFLNHWQETYDGFVKGRLQGPPLRLENPDWSWRNGGPRNDGSQLARIWTSPDGASGSGLNGAGFVNFYYLTESYRDGKSKTGIIIGLITIGREPTESELSNYRTIVSSAILALDSLSSKEGNHNWPEEYAMLEDLLRELFDFNGRAIDHNGFSYSCRPQHEDLGQVFVCTMTAS